MSIHLAYGETDIWVKVAYQAGVNEKLLGEFIRKHNVRDKIFSQSFYAIPSLKYSTDNSSRR